jgi:hypothetical protein
MRFPGRIFRKSPQFRQQWLDRPVKKPDKRDIKQSGIKVVIMKFSAFLLVLLATTAQAEVYKSINASGEVIYSDVPSRGAKPVQMPELPTYTPAPLPVAQPSAAPAQQPVNDTYSAFSLAKPSTDETIRSNAGIVNVSVSLEPALQIEAGHRIQFFLDNKPQGKPVARLSASFRNVDRGTHTVAASVIDEAGESIIDAAPVTIHILRASLLQPSNPLNPAKQNNDSGGSSNNSSGSGAGSSSGDTASGADGSTSPPTAGSTGSVSRPKGF